MQRQTEELEHCLGYRFQNRDLLRCALTHRSWPSERGVQVAGRSDNEQLEFLGDAILGFVVSEMLIQRHPEALEGQLSQWKAHLVSAAHLHQWALELGLGDYLRLGKGEDRNGGRVRRALLSNALEAVIAAIYLDGGIGPARALIQKQLLEVLDSPNDVTSIERLNHKSVLQEQTQALGLPIPRYTTVDTSGPEHAKVFTVEVRVGTELVTRAQGSSKKAASQRAAELLLEQLEAKHSSPV